MLAFMVYYKGAIVSCFIEYYKQGEDYEKTHVFRNVTFRGLIMIGLADCRK